MSEVRVSELWIYPVKSLTGHRVQEAAVDDRGFAFDRRFMIVDRADRFLTQRERPDLARFAAVIEDTQLILSDRAERCAVPLDCDAGERAVTVWHDEVSARDAGDEAARWLSLRLDDPVRLVRLPSDTHRAADPRYARAGDLTSFADGFPFLLISASSIRDLAQRVREGTPPLDARRFRPNLVVDGSAPFAEDAWTRIEIGDVTFHAQKECSRCAVVNVDPDRARRTTEPLAALAKFRKRDGQVWFGQNLVHDGPGVVRVGDLVRVDSRAA